MFLLNPFGLFRRLWPDQWIRFSGLGLYTLVGHKNVSNSPTKENGYKGLTSKISARYVEGTVNIPWRKMLRTIGPDFRKESSASTLAERCSEALNLSIKVQLGNARLRTWIPLKRLQADEDRKCLLFSQLRTSFSA